MSYRTAVLVRTLTQNQCVHRNRHRADWVLMSGHMWDMVLYSPEREALPDLLALGGDDIFESGSRHLVDGLRAETVHVER